MCGLVCFGLGVKFHFLGLKAAKLSVCTLFLAQQNVKAGPKSLGDHTGLTFARSYRKMNKGGKTTGIRTGCTEVGLNWQVLSLFACWRVLLFTMRVGFTV